MKYSFLLLGGDLRSIRLAEKLSKDGNKVYTFGLEKSNEILENKEIEKCKNLKTGIERAQIIMAPVPFSSNGETINTPFSDEKIKIQELCKDYNNKILICGSINDEILKKLQEKYKKVIDIMKREDLAILNTIATAEGAIKIAIENTDTILQGSKVLILGFGRVAKTVASKFAHLSSDVTCAARKISDLAWIKAFGYKAIHINNMLYELKDFDIIINTVPYQIITDKELKHMNSNVLLIDLASSPGGIDSKIATSMGLKYVWALALPGKVAPSSSAEFLKETIYNILEQEGLQVNGLEIQKP